MARDVHNILLKVIMEKGEMTEIKAADYIKRMESQKRYSSDVWSWASLIKYNRETFSQYLIQCKNLNNYDCKCLKIRDFNSLKYFVCKYVLVGLNVYIYIVRVYSFVYITNLSFLRYLLVDRKL